MKLVDIARVDLGPLHNGRVARRNIFETADGTRVIVDKGRRVPVICLVPEPRRRTSRVIAYVTGRI